MRLIAVRTNERAAASLGISVFGVKLYAFSVAAAIAGLGGHPLRLQGTIVTYEQYNPLQSIFSVGWAVIGGLGFAHRRGVLGAERDRWARHPDHRKTSLRSGSGTFSSAAWSCW